MKQDHNKTGFTLVEIMVALSVFVLVISLAFGIFVHSLRGQRKTLSHQELLDQVSYAVEYMNRGIRMAKKQGASGHGYPACITEGNNYGINPPGNDHLKFIKWDWSLDPPALACYEFFLDAATQRLMERRGGAGSLPIALTSDELEVITLRFEVIGDGVESPGSQIQPRVTIVLEVEGRGLNPEERPKIHLQTSVSQRDLDI